MDIGSHKNTHRRAIRRSWTDKEVILWMRDGKVSQYEHLVRRYSSRLYKIARCFNIADQDTENILIRSFLTAFDQRFNYHLSQHFAHWLTKIHLKICHEHQKINILLPSDTFEGLPQLDPVYKLEQTIKTLSVKDRVVLVLRDIEKLERKDIAYLLDMPEIRIKMRLIRSRMVVNNPKNRTRLDKIYHFETKRCDHVATTVMTELHQLKLAL